MAKRPNPKKNMAARRRRPDRFEPGRFTAGLLDPATARRVSAYTNSQAPPEAIIPVVTSVLWTGIMQGQPANVCVDACLTIGHALGQFGIRTALRAADLGIRDARDGQTILHGHPAPHWDGKMLVGHCILTLPDQDRFIDATVEQFPQVRALRLGPIAGRSGGAISPHTGRLTTQTAGLGRLPAGSHLAVQRENLVLLYVLAEDEYNRVILDNPIVQGSLPDHRRTGINLASLVVSCLRSPDPEHPARQAAYPRLHALLDAIGDAEITHDENHDCRFLINGSDSGPRLDELPLPAGTPPPAAMEYLTVLPEGPR
jgi:hypothetical protein